MSSRSGKRGTTNDDAGASGDIETPQGGVVLRDLADHAPAPPDPWNTTNRLNAAGKAEPSSAAPGEACLVLLYPPGPDMGKRFPLTRPELFLGRDRGCDIKIERDSISRRHARLSCSEDGWRLQDLQSTNGTYVNDVGIQDAPVRAGDLIRLGGVILKFLAGAGIEAGYHDELYKLSIQDALTSAHNRRYFLEACAREVVRSARYGRPLSLLMLDVDHFRALNDKHGHLTGDSLLRELVRRIRGRLPPETLLARYGGGEFAIVLPEADLTSARALGEQLCWLVAEHPFEADSLRLPLSVSIGVACVEGGDLDVSRLLKLARDNLHRAKREGRNRVVAGVKEWHRWRAEPDFHSQVSGKTAIAALALLARDQTLASAGGAAYVDDLEGLLYARLREHQQADQALLFGELDGGGGKLLVGVQGRGAVHRLRAILFEAMRRCAAERPEARFAVGPIVPARDGARAIEEAVAGLDDEIATLENGHHLPQPLALALHALDGTTARIVTSVLRLSEALLQWVALCATAEIASAGGTARMAAALRSCLEGGAPLARWHDLLTVSVEDLLESGAVHDSAWRACFGEPAARDEVLASLRILVELRDAYARDATSGDEHLTHKILEEATPRLRQLIRRDLRAVLALIPAEIGHVRFEGELQSYRMTRLIGDGLAAPVSMYSRRRMNPGLWLCDPSADRAIPLEPLCVRDTCPKCGARELFLLHRHDELELRNPGTGHVLRKSADDLPLSPEARDRLAELTAPASVPAPPPASVPAPPTPPTPPAPPTRARGGVPPSPGGAVDSDDDATVVQVRGAVAPDSEPSRPVPVVAPSAAAAKHTILFLAANPTGTDHFALDREARAIQVELERSGFRDCFELETRWAAEPLDLLRELRKLRPTVIHFSGHGRSHGSAADAADAADAHDAHDAHDAAHAAHAEPEHGLYFQGPDGQPQLVSGAALEETIGAAGASVRLVVLNACYSEEQAEALLAHVDCIVGVSCALRDEAARSFAIGFYGGLAERESVLAAYKQGRAAISLEGLRDADRPQLKVRAGVDAAKLVLAAKLP